MWVSNINRKRISRLIFRESGGDKEAIDVYQHEAAGLKKWVRPGAPTPTLEYSTFFIYNNKTPSGKVLGAFHGQYIGGQFLMLTSNGGVTYASQPEDLWAAPVQLNYYYHNYGSIFAAGYYVGYGYFSTGSNMGGSISYAANYAGPYTERRVSSSYVTTGMNYITAGVHDGSDFVFLSGRATNPKVGYCATPDGTFTVVEHTAPEQVGDYGELIFTGGQYITCVAGYSSYKGYIAYTSDITGSWSYRQISTARVNLQNLKQLEGKLLVMGKNMDSQKGLIYYADSPGGMWTYVAVDGSEFIFDVIRRSGKYMALGYYRSGGYAYNGVYISDSLTGPWEFTEMHVSPGAISNSARFIEVGDYIYALLGDASSFGVCFKIRYN